MVAYFFPLVFPLLFTLVEAFLYVDVFELGSEHETFDVILVHKSLMKLVFEGLRHGLGIAAPV